MGSEDLFHKRKAKAASELKRQKHERTRNKRCLIVCEGTKTEPQYLSELLQDLGIRPHVVQIARNQGVSPDRVVKHAESLYDEDAVKGDAFDTVYCVFDRDKHTTFDEAVKKTEDLSAGQKPFVAITSTPCFEVWLLLHFGYSDRPFHAAGNKSIGDQVVGELKTKPGFEQYGKGQTGVYAQLKPALDQALSHAQRLRANQRQADSINPSTELDILVKAIQALAT